MRAFLASVVPILCALYLMDKYEFGGYYAGAFWIQGTSVAQQYEAQLRDWWRQR